GDDVFIWRQGDNSDVVDGGSGFDTLDFQGFDQNESVIISAQGDHALFSRAPGNVTMDLHSIERIQFEARGGADHLVVNDLTGTDVKQIAIDLGANDGQADSVTVNGTNGADLISVASSGSSVVVNGLSAQVTIDGAEAANDSLTIRGLDGNDTIDASGLNAGQIKLTIDGGAGNDTIIGSAGDDTFLFTFGTGGTDVIQDFQAHGTSAHGDVVSLTGFVDHTFDQAVADGHIAQSGADVVISDGTNDVAVLQNVLLTSLHANDFLFILAAKPSLCRPRSSSLLSPQTPIVTHLWPHPLCARSPHPAIAAAFKDYRGRSGAWRCSRRERRCRLLRLPSHRSVLTRDDLN